MSQETTVASGSVQLSRLDFLELEALQSAVCKEIIEGRQRVEQAQAFTRECIEEANQRLAGMLRELAVKYEFDPNKQYKTCLKTSRLIEVDAQGNEV